LPKNEYIEETSLRSAEFCERLGFGGAEPLFSPLIQKLPVFSALWRVKKECYDNNVKKIATGEKTKG
jgi:hypothetical protein